MIGGIGLKTLGYEGSIPTLFVLTSGIIYALLILKDC